MRHCECMGEYEGVRMVRCGFCWCWCWWSEIYDMHQKQCEVWWWCLPAMMLDVFSSCCWIAWWCTRLRFQIVEERRGIRKGRSAKRCGKNVYAPAVGYQPQDPLRVLQSVPTRTGTLIQNRIVALHQNAYVIYPTLPGVRLSIGSMCRISNDCPAFKS